MIKIYLTLFAILFFSVPVSLAQNGENNGELYEIDIYGNRNNHKEFKLSEIASEVQYVKLESHPDAMVGYGTINRCGDHFVVGTYQKPIMIFSSEGKFLREIGSIGPGPEEYTNPGNNKVNSENQTIYVLCKARKVIHKYSISGEFLGSFELPYLSHQFCVLPDGNIIIETHGNYKNDGFYPFCLIDDNGKLLKEIKCDFVPPGKRINAFIPTFSIQNDGSVIIGNFGWDHFYTINSRGELKRLAHVDLGKWAIPEELYFDWRKLASVGIYEFASISKCSRIGKYLRVNYQDHWNGRVGIFNTETSEFSLPEDSESEGNGFRNDLDGGPTFWSHFHDEEFFFNEISAIELIENREIYANQPAIYPEKKKALLDLIDSLQPDDNPVIMMVKLKSI